MFAMADMLTYACRSAARRPRNAPYNACTQTRHHCLLRAALILAHKTALQQHTAEAEEIADRRPPRTPSASWWFQLSPGDVWCMPGDKEHGYVRWNCYHGLPHDEIKEECQPAAGLHQVPYLAEFALYGYARSP